MNSNDLHSPRWRWPFAARVAAVYLLVGVTWLLAPEHRSVLLFPLTSLLFSGIFLISVAVPAWTTKRGWARVAVVSAAAAFLGAWGVLLALEAWSATPRMLGCDMHEVDEGGLPDAVCMGPLPFFSSGRRALWTLPLLVAQTVTVAFFVAAGVRALRRAVLAALPARMGASSRERPLSVCIARMAAHAWWIVPGALLAGALTYSPVLQARQDAADAAWKARPRPPTASVFFRSEDDSLEVGDATHLVAWAWYSPGGDAGSQELEGVRITYASTAPRIASVDSMGRVRALSPGTADITLTAHALLPSARLAEGKRDTVRIRVVPADAALRALRFTAVSAYPGAEFGNTCAAADSNTYCWGYGLEGRVNEEDGAARGFTVTRVPERITGIAVGGAHRCVLTALGRAYCWGGNTEGQLGVGSRLPLRRSPVEVQGGHRWRQIRSGGEHTCAITLRGALYCWGSDRNGQISPATNASLCPASLLGINRSRSHRWRCALAPVPILPLKQFAEVAVGRGHSCALEVTGSVWCWGENYNHQAGYRTEHTVRLATRIAVPPLVRLAAGNRHNCGVDARGRAYCWGYYQFGNQPDEDPGRGMARGVPVSAPEPLSWIVAGEGHNCGLTRSGRAYCWGQSGRYALGSGAVRDEDIPMDRAVAVAGVDSFRALAIGDDYSCGVSAAGGLYCWGHGLSFRFSGGNLQEHPEPFRLAGPIR